MIICEGMDNSGKSVMAKRISEMFNIPLITRLSNPEKGKPPDNSYMVNHTLNMLELNPKAVFDRFPVISEAVYGPILRGGNAFDTGPYLWNFYLEKLRSIRPLIIYCRPPNGKILSFGSREQMSGVVEQSHLLLHRYDLLMAQFRDYERMFIHRYNFTLLEEPGETLNVVETCIKLGGR